MIKKIALLGCLLIQLSACIKEPLLETDVPTTPAAVQSALSDGWGSADPLSMKPNDFLFQETEQKLESNPAPFFVLQEGITISKKEESDTSWLYTFLYQNKIIKGSTEGAEATREDHRTVNKMSQVIENLQTFKTTEIKTLAQDYQMTLGFERLFGLAYSCIKTDAIDTYCKDTLGYDSCEINCYNLTTTEETLPVPDLMQMQTNCGGYQNCSYKVKKIKFDWTIALKKGETIETQRVNYSVALSQDMPFFSRMTEYCFRQLFPVQNQKVLVTTCTKLKNYKPASL